MPVRFRAPLLRAAARWNVSAALLAAQLMAESNFNPYAVSPAGAQGIAQFIPSMHLNVRMHQVRTTVELSDRTYTRLRARAAERGMRGFSPIVEEALDRYLGGDDADIAAAMTDAEGAWSENDVKEWERAREEAWATWPASRYSTPTS